MPSSVGDVSSFSNPSTDSFSPPSTETLAEGCISFTVYNTSTFTVNEEETALILAIPRVDISRLALRPYKWLRYLGFAILGLPGFLSTAKDGSPLPETTMSSNELEETTLYLWYICEAESFTLRHAVNPTILARWSIQSTTSSRAPDFRTDLVSAQGEHCPFTCVHHMRCEARHVIAFSRTAHCLADILLARQVPLTDPIFKMIEQYGINAVPNGYLVQIGLHKFLDLMQVAVLRTPNKYMDMHDVPPSRQHTKQYKSPRPAIINPTYRYTMHALDAEIDALFLELPADGIFPTSTADHHLPHWALLDWAYGTAAVEMWAHGSKGRNHLAMHRDALQPPLLTAASQDQPRASPTPEQSARANAWAWVDYFMSIHPAVQSYHQRMMEAEHEHEERINAWVQTSASGINEAD